MTNEAFEVLYAQVRDKAVAAATKVSSSRDEAEDAVQVAALYFLERLGCYTCITPSLFIEMAVKRAKDIQPSDRPEAKRRARRELAFGTALELDAALYGPDVE